jgi:hypothetical protein
MSRQTRRSARFVPAVESLEGRCTPSGVSPSSSNQLIFDGMRIPVQTESLNRGTGQVAVTLNPSSSQLKQLQADEAVGKTVPTAYLALDGGRIVYTLSAVKVTSMQSMGQAYGMAEDVFLHFQTVTETIR